MPDRPSDGPADRLPDGVGESDEAEVVGEGGDDLLSVVAGALAHHGAEDLQKLVGFVVGHHSGPGSDEGGAVRLDDAAADRRPEVATEDLLDLGAETLV